MHSKKISSILEWLLVGLMIGTIMFLGRIRMHQINISRFLILGYLIIVLLMIAFYWVNKNASPTVKKK